MSRLKKEHAGKRECLILFHEGYVSVAPTIINVAKSLAELGYAVTIVGIENAFSNIDKIDDNIAIVYLKDILKIPFFAMPLGLLRKLRLGMDKTASIISFISQLIIYMLFSTKTHSSRIDFCIGVDIYGSVSARLLALFLGKKYIYLSLELVHPDSFKLLDKIVYALERDAFRYSEFVLIQDKDRFETLCVYNKHKHPKVFYVPNTADSSVTKEVIPEDNYFRDKFGLSEEAFPYIILQAGIICKEVFAEELASAFDLIDSGYALIFHDRVKHEADDPYIAKLRQINSRNLFLSLEPVPFEELHRIFSSASIGVAFYKDIDNNFSQIAKASGKLSYYLKHGKPVLVSNLESLRELVEKYRIGLVINDPSNALELSSAIKTILDDYSYFSNNAAICFNTEFDYENHIKPVLNYIEGKLLRAKKESYK